jgi:hypothetical protein
VPQAICYPVQRTTSGYEALIWHIQNSWFHITSYYKWNDC